MYAVFSVLTYDYAVHTKSTDLHISIMFSLKYTCAYPALHAIQKKNNKGFASSVLETSQDYSRRKLLLSLTQCGEVAMNYV